MIAVGIAFAVLGGWLAHMAVQSWRKRSRELPPSTARQLDRARRANREDRHRLRTAINTPPAIDNFGPEPGR